MKFADLHCWIASPDAVGHLRTASMQLVCTMQPPCASPTPLCLRVCCVPRPAPLTMMPSLRSQGGTLHAATGQRMLAIARPQPCNAAAVRSPHAAARPTAARPPMDPPAGPLPTTTSSSYPPPPALPHAGAAHHAAPRHDSDASTAQVGRRMLLAAAPCSLLVVLSAAAPLARWGAWRRASRRVPCGVWIVCMVLWHRRWPTGSDEAGGQLHGHGHAGLSRMPAHARCMTHAADGRLLHLHVVRHPTGCGHYQQDQPCRRHFLGWLTGWDTSPMQKREA